MSDVADESAEYCDELTCENAIGPEELKAIAEKSKPDQRRIDGVEEYPL